MTEYMKHRITTYFENAKIDYGINASFIACTTRDADMLVKWIEEGTKFTMVIRNYKDYTTEEIFNIWMESDWSFWAD